MKISIIIRCLNEADHIGKLMHGIKEQTYKNHEIIVVDSGSTDGTLEIASPFADKIINIKPQDFSFGYALNVGCEAATGELLLFASAHIFPLYNDWLQQMAIYFQNDVNLALCYGRQVGDEKTKYSEHQIFAKWFPNVSNTNQRHPFCNNANCMIRRELWVKQKYDENLTGLEDLDWAKKILQNGHRIAYNAEASIVHVHREKYVAIQNRYRREAIAFRLINKNENFNFLTFLKLLFQNIWHDMRQAYADGKLLRAGTSIFLFRFNQYWGTYKGFKQSYLIDNEVRERFYYPKGYILDKDAKSGVRSSKIDYSKYN